MYKYDWSWNKTCATNHLNAKKQPLRAHEDILVFYKNQCAYNPQGLEKGEFNNSRPNHAEFEKGSRYYGSVREYGLSNATNYPINVLKFSNSNRNSLHPTQKPLDLIEYLIKTYTDEGDLVLDSTMGSGTTCLGAKNLGRKYIGIELDKEYYNIAKERVEGAK